MKEKTLNLDRKVEKYQLVVQKRKKKKHYCVFFPLRKFCVFGFWGGKICVCMGVCILKGPNQSKLQDTAEQNTIFTAEQDTIFLSFIYV